MSCSLKYKILQDLGLIIYKWKGNMNFEDIISLISNAAQDSDFSYEYNVLSDVREAKFEIETLDKLSTSKLPEGFDPDKIKRKTATITKEPNHIVFFELLNMRSSLKHNISRKAFSTIDSALKWLGVDKKYEKLIIDILDELAQ